MMGPIRMLTARLGLLALAAGAPLHAEVYERVAELPDDVRDAALVAASHPSLLTAITRLQQHSRQRFDGLLEALANAERDDIRAVTSMPGLVDRLVSLDDGEEDLQQVLTGYPPPAESPARRLLQYSPELLRAVARLNRSTETAFDALLEHEPAEVGQAMRLLVAHPGGMEALTGDLGGTVLLAEDWAKDPETVLRQMDELRPAPKAADPSGPYADVAATYQARYAYTPPESDVVETEVRFAYGGYGSRYWYGGPYWYGVPYHRSYWGASIGWHITPHIYASWSYAPGYRRAPLRRYVNHRSHGLRKTPRAVRGRR